MLIIHAIVLTTREERWVNNTATDPYLEGIITSKSAFLYYNDLSLLLH